jgi:predicted kinase
MKNPVAYILVGVPAAGKSTWYENFHDDTPTVYVSTDDFVERYAKEQGKTYNEVFKDYMPTAVKLMADVVTEARRLKMDIVWDQTSTTVKSRKKKFNMLPNYDMIAVVFPTPEKEELDRRLASRAGKNIPASVMSSMIDGFEMPTLEEGFKEVRIIS